MIAARGNGRNSLFQARCLLYSRAGRAAQEYREYRIIRRESNPKVMRYDGNTSNRSSENYGGGGNKKRTATPRAATAKTIPIAPGATSVKDLTSSPST